MIEGHQEFHDLMRRLREGSPGAAEELLGRYQEDVFRVVRHWMHKRLRKQFDSVDFVQSIWGSFFAMPAGTRNFADADALKGFLLDMATNKVIDAFRSRLQTQRRNANRECSMNDPAALEAYSLIAADPTPSQAVMADEAMQQLMHGLPETSQMVLAMLREGRTHREIADALRVSERSIHRLLSKLQPRLVP